MVENPQNRPK